MWKYECAKAHGKHGFVAVMISSSGERLSLSRDELVHRLMESTGSVESFQRALMFLDCALAKMKFQVLKTREPVPVQKMIHFRTRYDYDVFKTRYDVAATPIGDPDGPLVPMKKRKPVQKARAVPVFPATALRLGGWRW